MGFISELKLNGTKLVRFKSGERVWLKPLDNKNTFGFVFVFVVAYCSNLYVMIYNCLKVLVTNCISA